MDEGNRLDLVDGLNVQISLGAASAGGIGGVPLKSVKYEL